MKKSILIATLLLTFIITISCSSDDNKSITEQTESKFKGTWTGTYSGQSTGSWTAQINENGAFEGTVAEPGFEVLFELKGTVGSSGDLNANFYSNNQIVGQFKGNLATNSGEGTWNNTALNLSGTWQGIKN